MISACRMLKIFWASRLFVVPELSQCGRPSSVYAIHQNLLRGLW
jgi:hypothetical protein